MKKQLLILFLLAFSVKGFSQTTYYWVATTNAAWTAPASWNTQADGQGTARLTPAATDILIFDGAVMGTTQRIVSGIPRETVASITLKGNANVLFDAPAAFEAKAVAVSGTLYGGSTITLVDPNTSGAFSGLKVGDVITNSSSMVNQMGMGVVLAIKDANTITVSKDMNSSLVAALSSYYIIPTLHTTSFNIETGSNLTIGGSVSGFNFMAMAIAAKGGAISGSVNFGSRAGQAKLIGTTPNNGNPTAGLRFKAGSFCTLNGNSNGKNQFPLGATLGEYKDDVFIFNDGTGANNKIPGYSGAAGIVFEAGSTFTNQSGPGLLGSAFGHSITSDGVGLVFTPGTRFETGSNYFQNVDNNASPYFYSSVNAYYPNLELRKGVPANFTAARIENLTLTGTTGAVAASTGTVLVTGNISNNTANSINLGNIIFGGTATQTVTENTGDLVFADLVVADKAIVTLASNINATNVNLLGTLNFGTSTITGTGNFYAFGTFSTAASAGFTAGSNVVTGVNNLGAGTMNYPYPVGASVTNSSYLPSGTIYRSFTSDNAGTLSSFAKATVADGAATTFSNTGYKYTTSAGSLNASLSGFATMLVDVNGTTLPLSLISFKGREINGSVNLKWETVNELGVKEFVLLKVYSSTDKKEIARIAATNKASRQEYSFTDHDNGSANNFYQLKMIDADGAVTYSNLIQVKLSNLAPGLSVKLYPNPVSSILTVDHAAVTSDSRISVIDLKGRQILSKEINSNVANTCLDVSSLQDGTYILLLNNAEQKSTTMFIKH